MKAFSLFSASFFFTLNMHCMKALGVVHFKGNWTNKKKKKHSPHCAFSSTLPTLPQPTVINNRQTGMWDSATRRTGETFVRVCVCVETGVCHLRGVATWLPVLLRPVNKLMNPEGSSHGTESNQTAALYRKCRC